MATGDEKQLAPRIGKIGHGTNPSFCDNAIKTSKYTAVNFIPKNLFAQFRRQANIYFLLQSFLMFLGTYASYIFQSPVSPWATFGTLAAVMSVTLAKDGIEDAHRHNSDKVENTSEVTVVRDHKLTTTTKRDLRVGDIAIVKNFESVPADLICICSSSPVGTCYVETANIDGETNLKIRKVTEALREALPDIAAVVGSPEKMLTGSFQCEAPNQHIHSFDATLRVDGANGDNDIPMSISNFLIRGSVVRNTKWVAGVVIYTGVDTKIMRNTRKVPSKLSSMERTVNHTIKLVFLALFMLVTLSVVVESILISALNVSDHYYINESGATAVIPTWLASFFTFFILYSNFVPISLYVTIELVNVAQSYFINNDVKMYYEEDDVRALCRDSSLCQELGQVQYVFSDKTGTLTRNIMKFKVASINGVLYDGEDECKKRLAAGSDLKLLEFFRHMSVCNTVVPDRESQPDPSSAVAELQLQVSQHQLKGAAAGGVDDVRVDVHAGDEAGEGAQGEIRYEAESPDEGALVETAATCGIVLSDRTENTMSVDETGVHKVMRTYTVLAENSFNSTRKRMSVLVRTPKGENLLLCKGADSHVLDRCKITNEELKVVNTHLSAFASKGLRTLVFAVRRLSTGETETWMKQYNAALLSVSDRAKLLDEASEEIEKGMHMLGATGVEDKLQEGVPEAISVMREAGINLWMLTGDKVETAINIGKSCCMITDSTNLIELVDGDLDSVRTSLGSLVEAIDDSPRGKGFMQRFVKKMTANLPSRTSSRNGRNNNNNNNKKSNAKTNNNTKRDSKSSGNDDGTLEGLADLDTENNNGTIGAISATDESGKLDPLLAAKMISDVSRPTVLVVDGVSLAAAMVDNKLAKQLLKVAGQCSTVIACRVSPKQKASIVKLVRKNVFPTPVTLAIGDGANDVTMIQEAHLGVGVRGREGRHAVNSSDFAIGQFSFLQRLLLVHGRWNYRRMTKVILLCFYKNIALVLTLFVFNFFAFMSGLSLYDSWVYSGWNFFSGMPPLLIGVFDRDVSEANLIKRPDYYRSGQEKQNLNSGKMAVWIGRAVSHAVLTMVVALFWVGYWMGDGDDATFGIPTTVNGVQAYGIVVYTALYFVVMTTIGLETSTWNPIIHFFFWGSIVFYFVGIVIISSLTFYPEFWQVAQNALPVVEMWSYAVLMVGISLTLDITTRHIKHSWFPSKYDYWVMEDLKTAKSGESTSDQTEPPRGILLRLSSNPDVVGGPPSPGSAESSLQRVHVRSSSFVDSFPAEDSPNAVEVSERSNSHLFDLSNA